MQWRERVVPVLEKLCPRFVDRGLSVGAVAIDADGVELAKAGDFRAVDTSALAALVAKALDGARLLADGAAVIDGPTDDQKIHVRRLGGRVIFVVVLVPSSRADEVRKLLDEVDGALALSW